MNIEQLNGIFPALTTPLTPEGKPDFGGIEQAVEMCLQSPVAGLVPMGGTGEFTALNNADRVAVVRHVIKVTAGRAPVLPGIVAPGLGDAVDLGAAYVQAGAEAIMLVTPFYVTPSQQGVRDYFRAFKARVDVPLVYYDIPQRTRFVTDIDTFADLAADGTIIGAKICNTDLHYFNQLAMRVGDAMALLSGDDTLYVAHRLHGARGGILATAAALPGVFITLDEMLAKGDVAGAIAHHRALMPLLAALFNEVNPGPLKTLMAGQGIGGADVALPLQQPSAVTKALLDQARALIAAKGWS